MDFMGSEHIIDEVLNVLAHAFPSGVTSLTLRLVHCKKIDDEGSQDLALALPSGLTELQGL